jgi:hypothetical protein
MNQTNDGADVFADHTMRTILIGQTSRPRSPQDQPKTPDYIQQAVG